MALTRGGQDVIRWVEESTEGTFPSDPTLNLFSEVTTNISTPFTEEVVEGRTTDSVNIVAWVHTQKDFEVEVEFMVEAPADLQNFAERVSDGTVRTFSIERVSNQDGTPYYTRFKGMKPQSVEASASTGEAWTATVTFTGGDVDVSPQTTDPGIGTGSRESSTSESVKHFAGANVQQGGSDWATIVDDFSFTIDHGTEAVHGVNQKTPDETETVVGIQSIEGSGTIAFEDAGSGEYSDTDNESTFTLSLLWGTASGDPKWEFQTTIFPEWNPELAADDKHVLADRPWQAQTVNFTTV